MNQFKAESKRLLDLMINSIYTNKDIFLRELISNASDAIDKRHFMSLTDTALAAEFKIKITADETLGTLTIEDNGIGMTKEELENNLGTIAASGTFKFKAENKTQENMIGQFGVGFYAAFMVASKIEVISKSPASETAYLWTSGGADGYEIKEAEKADIGTKIVLTMKQKDEDSDYSLYLKEFRIRELIKKYSDYIRYPIVMEVKKSEAEEKPVKGKKAKKSEEKEAYTEFTEEVTLNSMIPLWRKPKAQTTDEEYNEYYKARFHDYQNPMKVFSANIEGNLNYSAMLFVPEKAPYDYYSKEYQKGLALYSNGVMIMEKCADLLPDYLGFLKGIIDSPDLSLNISREILQQDRQLKSIAASLLKKIIGELTKWLKNQPDSYAMFFKEFGTGIKYGVYDNYGEKKDELKDLIMFYSSTQKKAVTLKDYVSRMKEEQKFIYYASGDSIERIDKMPQTERIKDGGFEILYMSDSVDEFCLMALNEYEKKSFKNVAAKDLGVETQEEKDKVKDESESGKKMLDEMKNRLSGKVKGVRLSARMKSHAVCLTADGEVSIEMEKVLNAIPGQERVKADRMLEINPSHKAYEKLKSLFDADKDAFLNLTDVLYDEALLIEGLQIEDPSAFAEKLNKLLCG